jgi:hypothetical protein
MGNPLPYQVVHTFGRSSQQCRLWKQLALRLCPGLSCDSWLCAYHTMSHV